MMANRRGFSLAEVLISMTIAMVVIASATQFSMESWKTRRNWTVRETVDRDARFVGLSLARDVQEAGIGITSSAGFASVDTRGDTISILAVPYEPDEAPVYSIYDDGGGGGTPTYPAGGNCGATCIEFNKTSGTMDLAVGDIVNLQVGQSRRLLLLTSVASSGGSRFRVNFLPRSSLAGRPSGLDSLLLMRSGTTIQKVGVVLYWRDAGTRQLFRAQELDITGQPLPMVMANEVDDFEARLLFLGGAEHASYNGFDADTTNDGDDIIGVKVRALIKSQRADPAVNGGVPVSRWYEWQVAPRNLMYEKNRL